MSVGEDAPCRRRQVAWGAVAALLLGVVAACGGSSSPDNQASFGSSSADSSAGPETTPPATGTPFPDGVYQWELTADDWTAAGLPPDTEADVEHHVVTFAGGTAYDIAILRDGSREPASEWRYTPSGDHQVTLTDDGGRSLTLQWEMTGNELIFQMGPDQGEPFDRVLWTARPLRKVG